METLMIRDANGKANQNSSTYSVPDITNPKLNSKYEIKFKINCFYGNYVKYIAILYNIMHKQRASVTSTEASSKEIQNESNSMVACTRRRYIKHLFTHNTHTEL